MIWTLYNYFLFAFLCRFDFSDLFIFSEMNSTLELPQYLELAGSALSLFFNVILFYIITKFSRPEYGSYRILMLVMTSLYVVYSAIEVIVLPVRRERSNSQKKIRCYFTELLCFWVQLFSVHNEFNRISSDLPSVDRLVEILWLIRIYGNESRKFSWKRVIKWSSTQKVQQTAKRVDWFSVTFCAVFGCMQVVLAAQFIYRFLAVAGYNYLREKYFKGRRHTVWVFSTVIFFINWFVVAWLIFGNRGDHPRELAIAVEDRFGRNISDMAFTLVTYAVSLESGTNKIF